MRSSFAVDNASHLFNAFVLTINTLRLVLATYSQWCTVARLLGVHKNGLDSMEMSETTRPSNEVGSVCSPAANSLTHDRHARCLSVWCTADVKSVA